MYLLLFLGFLVLGGRVPRRRLNGGRAPERRASRGKSEDEKEVGETEKNEDKNGGKTILTFLS